MFNYNFRLQCVCVLIVIFFAIYFLGTSTAELNEVEKGVVQEEKSVSGQGDKSTVDKYLNESKVGRVSFINF